MMKLSKTPDHDFHNAWGSVLTSRSISEMPRAAELWQAYGQNKMLVERQYHALLAEYTHLFRNYFQQVWPMSLHAHASDAMVPTTIATLLVEMAAASVVLRCHPDYPEGELHYSDDPGRDAWGDERRRRCLRILGWTDLHVKRPRFAVIRGSHGAGYGPLAHCSKEWEVRAIASGEPPLFLDPDAEDLEEAIRGAKEAGCIALLIELIRSTDQHGHTLQPEQLRRLMHSCSTHGVFVVMDECTTAIRCGAPFSYQRPEYARVFEQYGKPDLVVFGKALGLSGLGVDFNGQAMQRFHLSTVSVQEEMLGFWHAAVARPIQLPVLIEAIGILSTAVQDDWLNRAVEIGAKIRAIIKERSGALWSQERVAGVHALLCIDRPLSDQFLVMAAIRRRSRWVRWLPRLDEELNSMEYLDGLLGSTVAGKRLARAIEYREAAQWPLWCFICGLETVPDPICNSCCLATCGSSTCIDRFGSHPCLSKRDQAK